MYTKDSVATVPSHFRRCLVYIYLPAPTQGYVEINTCDFELKMY